MSFSKSASRNSKENNESPIKPYEVQKHDVLLSSTTRYQVIDFNGEGSFGKVATCVNLTTGTKVAIKIHKENENVSGIIQDEIKMLRLVMTLNPEKNNIVNFIEDFRFNNLSCLAFEMLDRSLWDLLEERSWIPLNLNEIRPIAQQLMVAFDALKSIGVLHTDLKPDNIMLINHRDQPFKIKLIDFGLARRVSEVVIGTIIQPSSFRAPEVTLGLPLTEAIDMWGVGCILAFLYFGRELFPRDCSYNLIRSIVHLLGQPADYLLHSGVYCWAYFCLNEDPDSPGIRLRSPAEFTWATGIETQFMFTFFDFVENLEDAVLTYPAKKSDTEYADRMEFLSLLKSIFDLDPEKRLTPRESLKTPFLSMVHLEKNRETSSYLDEALQRMTFPSLSHLDSESYDSRSNTNMDTSEKMDSSYEKSDPQVMEADSNIEPSSASLSEIFTDNSSARDVDIESFCDDNSEPEDCISEDEDRCSDIESYICEESLTDSLNCYDADMENYSENYSDVERSFDGDPHTSGNNTDVESSVDDDHIPPTRMTCFDNPGFTGEEDIKPVSSSSSDGDNTETTETSLHIYEAYSQKRPSTPLFSGDNLPQVGHEVLQDIINEETFTNELQAEKKKNILLQEELERLSVSYQLMIARYEDDALKNREQADALQQDLDNEILQKNRLQCEFDKATAALQEEREKNWTLQNQLNKTIVALYENNLSYQTHITDVREQADALQQDLDNEILQKNRLQSEFDKATAALQEEREKDRTLQNQLNKTIVSLYEDILSYQTHITDVREQANTLRSALKRELKQNKLLQASYDKLQETYKWNHNKFSSELHTEKEKNKALQQEMDKLSISATEISHRYEGDVTMVTQQVDTLQCEMHNFRAEQEAFRQKMAAEITVLQQNAFEKDKIYGRELDELKTQVSVQISLNLKLSAELKAEREANQKITGRDDDCKDEPSKQQESIPNAEPLEPTEEAEVPQEMPSGQQESIDPAPPLNSQRDAERNPPQTTAEPPSAWKRIRHFLGLRKPRRWKRRREEEE